jgi:hypothetical protein
MTNLRSQASAAYLLDARTSRRARELPREVRKLHELPVIYASAYAPSLPKGQVPEGAAFLPRPFRFAALAGQLKLVTRKVLGFPCLPLEDMIRIERWLFASVLLVMLWPARAPLCAAGLTLPPGTAAILDHMYSGQHELALSEIRQLQKEFPTHPLPYLLEAELDWWKIWCTSAEFKYGMTMARHREKSPADQEYLDLARKAYGLAEDGLREQETAEMHLYAGMADALEARLYGLRWDTRATARSGVRARAHFLSALAREPALADADTGLGLYNYYVDTLSAMARVLRFFMGIPGGSKEEGIRQLNTGIRAGQLTPAAARFYLALNLENYDQRYAEALQAVGPLAEKYPQNPMYLLVRGDLNAKLGKKKLAESSYRAALAAAGQFGEPQCQEKMTRLAEESLAAIGAS